MFNKILTQRTSSCVNNFQVAICITKMAFALTLPIIEKWADRYKNKKRPRGRCGYNTKKSNFL